MFRLSEADKFELGTISLFTGLSFITFVPVLLKLLLIYIEPNFFKIIGGLFILISAIFYYFSPDYYKKQLFILGINLTIFSFFQLFFGTNVHSFRVSSIVTLTLGIFLIFISIYLYKRKK
jgi:hypothetical protein